jgi:ubiquinone/menaquinone biosynthesis C-methylase UbiE
MDVLKESYRILKNGGKLIICEGFKRWNIDNDDKLEKNLIEVGFKIDR